MTKNQRLSVEVLEEDFDGKVLHCGVPYTGISFEVHDRNLTSETYHQDGLLHGTTRRWNEFGQLLEEENYFLGLGHGENWSWYPNGKRRFYSMECMGFLIEEARWNQDGIQCLSTISETIECTEKLGIAISRGFPMVEIKPRFPLNEPLTAVCDDFRNPPGLIQ